MVFYSELKTFPFHLANTLIFLILGGIKDFQRKGNSLVSQDDHKTLGSKVQLMSSGECIAYPSQNYTGNITVIDDFL